MQMKHFIFITMCHLKSVGNTVVLMSFRYYVFAAVRGNVFDVYFSLWRWLQSIVIIKRCGRAPSAPILLLPSCCDSEHICKGTQWTVALAQSPVATAAPPFDPAVCQSAAVHKSPTCWGRTANHLAYKDWSEGCARKTWIGKCFIIILFFSPIPILWQL